MDWKSHLVIGIVASLALFYLLIGVTSPLQLLPLAAIAGLSALIPDIDTGQSKGRKVMDVVAVAAAFFLSYSSSCSGTICIPGLGQLGAIAMIALALLGAYLLFVVFVMPRHRGVVHSLAMCIGFTVLLYVFIGRYYALAGFIGFFSHLAADNSLKLA